MMEYEIDRDHRTQPSLLEMAGKALELLTFQSKKKSTGFFLMIEGSRIDMAAHSNDPATHVHEILMYNKVVAMVKEYVDANPDTLLISTSDHETGGLSVAHQHGKAYPEYIWYPEKLVPVKHSAEYIARVLFEVEVSQRREFLEKNILEWTGLQLTDADLTFLSNEARKSAEIVEFFASSISDSCSVGWSTHGHSAVDVNLYSYGTGSEKLRGNHENTEIYNFIKQGLGI
jgi:alkaline phosphatase